MDKNDILKRLQAGESVDSIAQNLTDLLNEAQKEKKRLDAEAKAKKEAEEKAENERLAQQAAEKKLARSVSDALNAYYTFVYGADNFDTWTPEEVMDEHGSPRTKSNGSLTYTCTKDGKTTTKTIPLNTPDFAKALRDADRVLSDWLSRW